MATEEGWHTVEDGMKLYTKTWKVSRPTGIPLTSSHPYFGYLNRRQKVQLKLGLYSSMASVITVSYGPNM